MFTHILRFFLIMLLPVLVQAKPSVVLSGYPNFFPFTQQDQQTLHGISIDIAKQLFTHLNIKFEIKYMGDTNKVNELAKQGAIDAILAIDDDDPQFNHLVYSIPYVSEPVRIFDKKHGKLKYSRWRDLIGWRGVVQRNRFYGKEFTHFAKQNLTLAYVNDPAEGFHAILSNKADYFIGDFYYGMWLLKKAHLNNVIHAEEEPLDYEYIFMAFPKQSFLAKKLELINQTLLSMINDGTITQIVKKKEISLLLG